MSRSVLLTISSPCHEDWAGMTPVEQGRFCASCQKNVTDFSTMTDAELMRHISSQSGAGCGKFRNDQLERIIKPETGNRYSFKYVWGLMIAATLLSYRSNAQVKKTKASYAMAKRPLVPAKVKNVYGRLATISGRVVTDKGRPVPYASVKIDNLTAFVVADSLGYFIIDARGDIGAMQLVVGGGACRERIVSIGDCPVFPSSDGTRFTIDMDEIIMQESVVVCEQFPRKEEEKYAAALALALEGKLGGYVVVRKNFLARLWGKITGRR